MQPMSSMAVFQPVGSSASAGFGSTLSITLAFSWRFTGFSGLKTPFEQLDPSFGRDLDVVWLQVAVQDAFLVRGFQAFGDLMSELQSLRKSQGTFLHALAQSGSLD